VRGVLTPMKDMAEELHVAVIGIAHFNKKDDIKSALVRALAAVGAFCMWKHRMAWYQNPSMCVNPATAHGALASMAFAKRLKQDKLFAQLLLVSSTLKRGRI
jgi:hypothetical protein